MTYEGLAERTGFVDLHHGGFPNVIAAAIVELDSGLAVIDPGPGSTIETLASGMEEGGYRLADVTCLLLTHIHLDHAGATGRLVRDHPALRVVVHERGARHLEDPSRLLKSAARIFGDRMDELWGPCLPVPVGSMDIVTGAAATLDGGRLKVQYTPGHASHHVSFFDTLTGIAFAGDATGGRIRDRPVILPATPPPDIHVETMLNSVDTILGWGPSQLFVTHFGAVSNPADHAARLRDKLFEWSESVRLSLDQPGNDEARAAAFASRIGAELRETMTHDEALACEAGAPPEMSWYGLARYWRKKADAG